MCGAKSLNARDWIVVLVKKGAVFTNARALE